jgi:hypothetical protein
LTELVPELLVLQLLLLLLLLVPPSLRSLPYQKLLLLCL